MSEDIIYFEKSFQTEYRERGRLMERFRSASGIKRRVLIVDDEPVNRKILGNILSEDYDIRYAENGLEAWELLNEDNNDYSLILLDLLMPVMDGFELLDKVRSDEVLRTIPVIVMTSEKEAEVKSIRQGAADFIAKPYDMPEVILARCERIIKLAEDNSIIRSAEKDIVTGLYTRDFFYEYIRQIDAHIDAMGKNMSMDALVFNIDHFHLVNEMYGRRAGNSVLVKVAQTINQVLEDKAAIACRPEGDMFYVYSKHIEDYTSVLDRIRQSLGDTAGTAKIRLRVGIYQNVDMSIDAETRFDRAKIACDRIKDDYTTTSSYYNYELHLKSIYHERLIRDIDESIKNEDFKVFFQPKYDITGDKPVLTSAEALIRWEHPELGMISPGDFIPLFENNGLIQRIDNYVWNKAAATVHKWKEKYGVSLPVSVNVSRIDIFDPEFLSKIERVLKDNDLTPNDLYLEITESAYADNAGKLTDITNTLRDMGFSIEMDDFGSGYSSLNMITSIPIDVLKLDMKFVRNMEKDAKSIKLVELVLDIAKFLDVPVVAEGVETGSQLDLLKKMGCQIIQGYYFSKPVPEDEFEKFIQTEKTS